MPERRRTVPLPGTYDVEISDLKPIIDHPLVQKMRGRRQLGTTSLVFPSATHTRFEHALGTLSLTAERAALWAKDGAITDQEALDLRIYALLHDIGHGPYSHESEALCEYDHNQNGLRILHRLEQAIRSAGGYFEKVKSYMEHADPLHLAVSHHPLGTDKLDYLIRDTAHTNDAIRVPVGAIKNYTHFIREGRGDLGIQIKICQEVKLVQIAYFYMYERVYLRKACLAVRRMLQKVIERLMNGEGKRLLSTENLYDLVDSQLDALMIGSDDPYIKRIYEHLIHRRFPKVAVALRPEALVPFEQICGKEMNVAGKDEVLLRRLVSACAGDPEFTAGLERQLESMLSLPEGSIFIVPTTHAARFRPADIPVFDRGKNVGTLSQMFPAHYEALRETADSYLALRVCTYAEHRLALSQKCGEVSAFLGTVKTVA